MEFLPDIIEHGQKDGQEKFPISQVREWPFLEGNVEGRDWRYFKSIKLDKDTICRVQGETGDISNGLRKDPKACAPVVVRIPGRERLAGRPIPTRGDVSREKCWCSTFRQRGNLRSYRPGLYDIQNFLRRLGMGSSSVLRGQGEQEEVVTW